MRRALLQQLQFQQASGQTDVGSNSDGIDLHQICQYSNYPYQHNQEKNRVRKQKCILQSANVFGSKRYNIPDKVDSLYCVMESECFSMKLRHIIGVMHCQFTRFPDQRSVDHIPTCYFLIQLFETD